MYRIILQTDTNPESYWHQTIKSILIEHDIISEWSLLGKSKFHKNVSDKIITNLLKIGDKFIIGKSRKNKTKEVSPVNVLDQKKDVLFDLTGKSENFDYSLETTSSYSGYIGVSEFVRRDGFVGFRWVKNQDRKVVYFGGFVTNSISPFENLHISAIRIAYSIIDVLRCGERHINKKQLENFTINESKKINYLRLLFILIIKFKRIIFKSLDYLLFRKRWILKVRGADLKETYLKPTDSRRIWADPFVVSNESEVIIFVEDMDLKIKKGVIKAVLIDNDFNIVKEETIIERERHVSYPFVFKRGNEWLMIPETGAEKKVVLYKTNNFPFDWLESKILIEDLNNADPTLVRWEDERWYMFVNVSRHDDISLNEELFIFWSDELNSTWTPHEKNPIISDSRFSRPAGSIFFDNGKWIRPSQYNFEEYGKSVNLMEITELSPSSYKEQFFLRIEPDNKKEKALHTYNKLNKFTIMDVNVKEFRL